jgi:long-chain fatty acid transport protein
MLKRLSLLGCVAICGAAFANGTRLPYQDMDAVARGYAFAATADTPAAIYYNPAGLAQFKEGAAEAAVYLLRPENEYRGSGGRASKARTETFTLPYFFLAQPLAIGSAPIVAGVGAYAPFGLSSEWDPTTSGFRTLATKNSLVFRRFALALSSQVRPELMVGASLQYNRMHADLNRGIGFVSNDSINFTGRGTAWSYNVGILYQPAKEHSFGVQYQSQTDFEVSGTVGYQPLNATEPSKVDWPFPQNYTISYSYRPTPEWNLEIGYDRTDWSSFGTLLVRRAASGPLPLVFNWQDSEYYEIGGTRYWTNGWQLSAGLCWSGNSVPDATFNPSVVDYDRWLWNAGIGYRTRYWKVSTLVQFSPENTRVVSGSLRSPAGESADGSYVSTLWAFGLQVESRW